MIAKDIKVSFEFFPPKTLEGKIKLVHVAQRLAKYNPHFFSVTYGAGGSTQQGSLEAIEMLEQATSVNMNPHLACIGMAKDELVRLIQRYKALGIKRLVALRGDLPTQTQKQSGLQFANELVALIREISGNYFHIHVACYPETHPKAQNVQQDILHLKRKAEAGANSAITQYFYNPDAYFRLVDDCQQQQISLPIVPGIMPITNYSKLVRFSEMCGAEIPRWLLLRLQDYQDDVDSIQAFGLDVVHQLCERLLVGGAPGLHFYTLNQAEPSLQILDLLNLPVIKEHNVVKFQDTKHLI